VPVDFSSSSDAALETASDLAQHFHAELYLLNVIPMLPTRAGHLREMFPSGPH